MPVVKLDSDFIKNQLICPAGMRRIEFCSQELPGLLVEVSNVSPGKGKLSPKVQKLGTHEVHQDRSNLRHQSGGRQKEGPAVEGGNHHGR